VFEVNSSLEEIQNLFLEPGSQMLLMDFADSEIETFKISWNSTQLQSLSIDLDKIIMSVIRAQFTDNGQKYALALPSFGIYIPDYRCFLFCPM